MTFSLQEGRRRIVGGMEYATSLFEPATMERISDITGGCWREWWRGGGAESGSPSDDAGGGAAAASLRVERDQSGVSE